MNNAHNPQESRQNGELFQETVTYYSFLSKERFQSQNQ